MSTDGGSGAPSLTQQTKTFVLRRLQNDLEKETRNATFACGGSISVTKSAPTSDSASADKSPSTVNSPSDKDSACLTNPVTIRYDTPNGGAKLVLPEDEHLLPALIATCQPANFSLGNKEVHDESYRKAIKLEPDSFLNRLLPVSHWYHGRSDSTSSSGCPD